MGLPGSGKTHRLQRADRRAGRDGRLLRRSRRAEHRRGQGARRAARSRSSELFHPKKTTPADVTYVDVAIPAGAAREGTIQPDVLAQIRNADALLHVARAFEGGAAERPADPWRDVDELDLEFAVADLTVVEKRLEKLRTSGRHGSPAEREQNALEEQLLGSAAAAPVGRASAARVGPDRRRRAAPARLSVPDPEAGAGRPQHRRGPAGRGAGLEEAGRARYAQPQTDVAALAGKIEAEIAQLPPRTPPRSWRTSASPRRRRGRVIRLTYGLLGLFSFFTAGEDECRAWTLRRRRQRGRRRGGHPHRPGARLHPRRGGHLRRPDGLRKHGRGAQARPAASRGEGIPGA